MVYKINEQPLHLILHGGKARWGSRGIERIAQILGMHAGGNAKLVYSRAVSGVRQ
jgi:hypothetical protein